MAGNQQIADVYLAVHDRLDRDLRTLDEGSLAAPVPVTPAWTVHGVVGHLAGVAEDAVAGRIAGIPTEEQTAAQASRVDGERLEQTLERWRAVVEPFSAGVAAVGMWPAAFDALTHEFDIRGALGDRAERDCPEVAVAAPLLLGSVDVGRPLRIETESNHYGDADAELVLQTTDFEGVRWRFGRRSRGQLLAMNWSEVPDDAVLDALCIFGPSELDVED